MTSTQQNLPTSPSEKPRLQCERCKLESEWTAAFHKAKKYTGLGFRRYFLCPRCWQQRQLREVTFWGCLNYVPLLLVMAMGLVLLGRSFWFYLNIAFWFIWDFALIVPHEAGHALVAWLLGLRSYGITVGIGPRIKTFKLGHFTLEFKLVPFGGLTWTANPNLHLARLKQFLVYLAGPLANAALVVAGLYLIPGSNPIHWFASALPKSYLGQALPFGVLFVLANASCVLFNLVPYRAAVDGMELDSDGLGMFRSLFASDESVRQWQIWYYHLESTTGAGCEQYAEAMQWCERELEEHPEDTMLRGIMAQLHFNSGELEKARELYQKLLPTFQDQTATRLALLDVIAHAGTLIGGPERLAEADAFSAECVQTAPWDSNYQATRGSVLIVSGKLDEGKAILEAIGKDLPGSSGQACVHSFLALAEAQSGPVRRSQSALGRGLRA